MTVARPTFFWRTIGIIALLMLVLLREILLPFVVGMALAYLLVPVVDRLERTGIDRGLAALVVVLVLTVGFVGLLLVVLRPSIGSRDFWLRSFHAMSRVSSLSPPTRAALGCIRSWARNSGSRNRSPTP